MRILLVEDDIDLAFSIEKFFSLKNYDVDTFFDGIDAINHLEESPLSYDAYLIDVNLPNINGLDILKFIRKTKIDTPIIVLTASLSIQTLQEAFDFGCTEYIKKPFNLIELEIRLNKILHAQTNIIHISEDFIYNKKSMDLKYKNQSIELRKKEKLFIDILFKNLGFIVSTDCITDYIWECQSRETYPIRQLVNTIRQKLPYNIIKTEVGVGYKIETGISA